MNLIIKSEPLIFIYHISTGYEKKKLPLSAQIGRSKNPNAITPKKKTL
jgi:hypothetical protein